ncbi:hypothetical protein Hdeb2414_s0002g00074031 [Helianthus debilis subsp. tardiflorus]
MPRNAYQTLQWAYSDFWRNLQNDKRKRTETVQNTNNADKYEFSTIIYTYKFSYSKLLCFQIAQDANVKENRDYRNAPAMKQRHWTLVLPSKHKYDNIFGS